MPDIQAGQVELNQQEADQQNQAQDRNMEPERFFNRVDELGDVHDESVYNHLGRS